MNYLKILLLTILVASSYQGKQQVPKGYVTNGKTVVNYILLANLDHLYTLEHDVKQAGKVNFNRLILSFVQPTINNYVSYNLACTGILGYYCNVRAGTAQQQLNQQLTQGAQDFQTLKNFVQLFQQTYGIEVYISVGGWDYNCNAELYCKTLNFYGHNFACQAPHFDYQCEPITDNQNFDYFPDPVSEASLAQNSYKSVIQLATELGVNGLDLDYEEFWHADWNRRTWNQDGFIEYIRTASYSDPSSNLSAYQKMQQAFNKASYQELVQNFSSSTPTRTIATGPFIMPDTIDKLEGVINMLDAQRNAQNPSLKFSFAGPAVGAAPIMVPQYGDANIAQHGGQWWGGNLKGLLYNLNWKSPGVLNKIDAIGVMTYDLGAKPGFDCGQSLPYGCTLDQQVAFYMSQYATWLRSEPQISLTNSSFTTVTDIVPLQQKITSKLLFGFEVGRPAYPKLFDDYKSMILVNTNFQPTLQLAQKYDGVIIWEAYKPVAGIYNNEVNITQVLQQSCMAFGLSGQGIDCYANVPLNYTNGSSNSSNGSSNSSNGSNSSNQSNGSNGSNSSNGSGSSCGNCYVGTTGPCQNTQNNVCYAALSDGTCPPATTLCSQKVVLYGSKKEQKFRPSDIEYLEKKFLNNKQQDNLNIIQE